MATNILDTVTRIGADLLGGWHLLGTALLVSASFHSYAWEADVHFGLTFVLAQEAGFDKTQSRLIAEGNLGQDEGGNAAVHTVFWSACLNKWRSGFESVRDNHFPSNAGQPGDQFLTKHAVGRNSPQARLRAEKERNGPQPPLIEKQLRDFGKALHALQDSWSHEGIPQAPGSSTGCYTEGVLAQAFCDEKFAFGHPKARGGWCKHDADLTTLGTARSAEVEEMAIATFHQLMELRKAYQLPPMYVTMNRLKPWIDRFARADTKAAKLERFIELFGRDEAIELVAIWEKLSTVSIPDGRFSSEKPKHGRHKVHIKNRGLTQHIPQNMTSLETEFLRSAVERFALFNTWTGGVDRSVFDSERIAVGLGWNERYRAKVSAEEFVKGLFKMWRIRDHGLIAKANHVPIDAEGNFVEAVKAATDDQLVSDYRSLGNALLPTLAEGDERSIVYTKDAESRWIAAEFRLVHAPEDALLFVAERFSGEWMVTGITWAVAH